MFFQPIILGFCIFAILFDAAYVAKSTYFIFKMKKKYTGSGFGLKSIFRLKILPYVEEFLACVQF